MNRRRFLQVGGLAGLAVYAAPFAERTLRADGAKYAGPFWVMINAGGGWDPTYLCDPKGGAANDKATVNQRYTAAEIGKAGSISYAPVNWTVGADKDGNGGTEVFSNKRFFDAHHQRLTVLNGVDTTTNNHDTGSRMVWSGQTAEGQPALAALVAGLAAAGASLPMAFLSNGGYDATAGVVPLTRTGSVDALKRVAYPERMDPKKIDSATFHTPDTTSRIAKAQAERLTALRGAEKLPTVERSMGSLFLARQSNDGLSALAAQLDNFKLSKIADGTPFLEDLQPVAGQVGDIERVAQQIQMALVAFQAGVAASVNINLGGFDTHSNHDDNQIPQMMKLARSVDYLFKMADMLGLADKMYVVMGSDFGRTPYYNAGNGKDHWNITSMLVAGPGVAGDRVIGSTDASFKANKIDPGTLQPSDAGIKINPTHVHKALRKLSGLAGSPVATPFELPGEDLPLFG
jgi:hypothetical protein